MFARPSVGDIVKVTTDWSDYFKPFCETVRILNSTRTHIGEVLPSDNRDDPETFRITTGRLDFPEAVISLHHIKTLEIGPESIAADAIGMEDSQKQKETWTVEGSKGNKYVVTRNGTNWGCTCPGYGFRRNCRHIKEKKEEVFDL